MSDELILHHYPESPYAEKIRRILGFKGLRWHSVIIPMVMPKPDLTALTGGYRKTPVLQIGADVYCDTDLIARVIDRVAPEPSLFPGETTALAMMLGPWQQQLFWLAVTTVGTSAPIFPPGFVEDRSTMVEGGISVERLLTDMPAQREQLRAKLELLEAHLASGTPYVLGAAASLADFSLFHPVYTLKIIPETASILAPYANLRRWIERIEAFGHGKPSELASGAAVDIAKRATPRAPRGVEPGEPNGLKAGDRIEIVHEDFGRDPVVGELLESSAHEIALKRNDARAGEVVVHFPREHYKARKL